MHTLKETTRIAQDGRIIFPFAPSAGGCCMTISALNFCKGFFVFVGF